MTPHGGELPALRRAPWAMSSTMGRETDGVKRYCMNGVAMTFKAKA